MWDYLPYTVHVIQSAIVLGSLYQQKTDKFNECTVVTHAVQKY